MGAEDLILPMQFGPYELKRLIAAGGMARVYEARLSGPHGFEKRLAVKMMLPEYAGDVDFVTMLIDEAKIAVRLSHSNICQVLDLGFIDGRYYIAMEYVEGADLNQVVNKAIQKGVSIPFDIIASIGQDIAAGLNYAHAHTDDLGNPLHIIHRDISPANILLSMSGEVKIVDFGVAKAASRSQHTQVGVVKGKYQYMSPEQVSGAKLDYRTDIFSAGIVLYESLAGQMLYFDGPDLLDRIRLGTFRPLERVRPDAPAALVKVIKKALARRAQDRYQTAGDLGNALAEFLLIYRATHGTSRLSDLMELLFGDEKRSIEAQYAADAARAAERQAAPRAAPMNSAEMIERTGSLVWNQGQNIAPAAGDEAPLFADETPIMPEPMAFQMGSEQADERTTERPGIEQGSVSYEAYSAEDFDDDSYEATVEVDPELHPPPSEVLEEEPTMSDSGYGETSPLYLVRDTEGRTSGPFSRAQLHELVLAGHITENDEVLPIEGGAPTESSSDGAAKWVPAATQVPVSPQAPVEPKVESSIPLASVPPSMTADLSAQSTARIFAEFASQGVTGAAVFDRPGARKEVTFHAGRPLYVTSNLPAEQLGERLVRLGVVTPEARDQGLRTASEHGQMLGHALVTLGLLEASTLDRCLEGLVRSRLLELFLWRSGHFAFYAGTYSSVPYHAPIDPYQLILEGVDYAAGSEGAVGWLLEIENRYLVASGQPTVDLGFFGVPKHLIDLLSEFRTPRLVRQVISETTASGLDGAQVARALMFALQLGFLAVVVDQ